VETLKPLTDHHHARVIEIGSISFALPVVQAGMGGGLSQHELAAAVTAAGGLGTVGMMNADAVELEIRQARAQTDGPIAANVLMPLARRAHWEAASTADLVVTFWGRPKRMTPKPWVHQCGSVDEALAAQRTGADAVIVQGVEAGGHVRGTEPALQLLERARAALPAGYPVLSSGNIADAADVKARLDAGAIAAVLGTRFLMTDESRAHLGYKQRLLEGRETVLTELFGLAWPAPHRVLWNEATERWLARDRRGPRWVRALNKLTAPVAARTPDSLQAKLLSRQSAALPFLSPMAVTANLPSRLLDVTPLYAGETVARIHDIRPAAEVVAELAAA
jgi:nitronate monooxygenase